MDGSSQRGANVRVSSSKVEATTKQKSPNSQLHIHAPPFVPSSAAAANDRERAVSEESKPK